MDKKYIVKLVNNETTDITVEEDFGLKIKNSIVNNYNNQVFYQQEINSKSIINIDDKVVTAARDYCRRNKKSAVNAYLYLDDVLLYAYLIRFNSDYLSGVNIDNPNIVKCNSIEFQKLLYRDNKAYIDWDAKLKYEKKKAEVYKIIDVENINYLKRHVELDVTLAVEGAVLTGLCTLLFFSIIEPTFKSSDNLLLYMICTDLDLILGGVGLYTFLLGLYEYLSNSGPNLRKVKNDVLKEKEVKKAIKEQKKLLKKIDM